MHPIPQSLQANISYRQYASGYLVYFDAHRVSSQLSPTRGDDFEISSLPSFYSPIGRGTIDHPPPYGSPTLLALTKICENDGPFVR
jgi:hypothetical protein